MAQLRIHQAGFPTLCVDCEGESVLAVTWERGPRRPGTRITGSPQEKALLRHLSDDVKRYFAGELTDFDWPFDWSQGTPFQREVWQALRKIPWGETRSYQWLARKIRRHRAVRAVGQANGANPFSLVVPCHRIIRADGSIGGYSGGLDIKRQLLQIEGIRENKRIYRN